MPEGIKEITAFKVSGTEIKLEGEEYVIMREDDILCVFE